MGLLRQSNSPMGRARTHHIDPATATLISAGINAGASALAGDGGEKDSAKMSRQTQVEKMLIELIQDAMDRRRRNEQQEKMAPFAAQVMRDNLTSLDALRGQGMGLSSFLSGREARTREGAAPSMGPAPGMNAAPGDLDSLSMPSLDFFMEQSKQKFSGISADTMFTPRESALGVLNQFEETGDMIHDSNNEPQKIEDILAGRPL